MYLRYSFIVVAPTHCNSPRLSAGLMMFEASIAPSAEPAPTIVWSSSIKRITFLERRISSITALIRSSNWPRYFVPATINARSSVTTLLSRNNSGTLPLAIAFAKQAEQNVFGADVRMIERLRFLAGERQNLFHARRVGNVADDFCFRPRADLLLDFHSHGLEIEPHFLENVDGDALAEFDQSEQKVLGADVIVIETVGLFASELQDLLGARCEIVHSSDGVGFEPLPESVASLLISGLGRTFKRARIICARRWSRSSALSFCCAVF